MSKTAKFDVTTKPSRHETLYVNPDDVVLGRNSRIVDNPTLKSDIERTAVSIVLEGQREPCDCHRDENNKIVIDAGQTRRAAVKLIREGFTAVDPTDGETRTFHVPEQLLWVNVSTEKVTEEQAFIRSLTENVVRQDMTDLQEALAQQVMRDEYQWTDKRIAAFFGYTNQNRVMDLKKLATARDGIQQMVHEGNLALSVYAHDLFEIDPKTCDLIIEKATDDKGRVQGAKVRDLLRNVVGNGEPIEGQTPKPKDQTKPPSSKSPKRSMKNLTDFLASYLESEDANPKGTELCSTLQRWLTGELKTDKKLLDVLSAL